mmetsp:Transcript_57091/g.107599  ORF Transcript_57091/g.107599 Transcript_57091/m.107599 type:complete len:109 (-) Transcript_57091:95-421(-)
MLALRPENLEENERRESLEEKPSRSRGCDEPSSSSESSGTSKLMLPLLPLAELAPDSLVPLSLEIDLERELKADFRVCSGGVCGESGGEVDCASCFLRPPRIGIATSH